MTNKKKIAASKSGPVLKTIVTKSERSASLAGPMHRKRGKNLFKLLGIDFKLDPQWNLTIILFIYWAQWVMATITHLIEKYINIDPGIDNWLSNVPVLVTDPSVVLIFNPSVKARIRAN